MEIRLTHKKQSGLGVILESCEWQTRMAQRIRTWSLRLEKPGQCSQRVKKAGKEGLRERNKGRREDITGWNVRNPQMTRHGVGDISEGQRGEWTAWYRGFGKF